MVSEWEMHTHAAAATAADIYSKATYRAFRCEPFVRLQTREGYLKLDTHTCCSTVHVLSNLSPDG